LCAPLISRANLDLGEFKTEMDQGSALSQKGGL